MKNHLKKFEEDVTMRLGILFLTRSLSWSKGEKRLIFSTSLRAKASRDLLLTIEPRFRDLYD